MSDVDDETTSTTSLDTETDPGVVLPAQFFREVRALGTPECRLRLAVLRDAIRQLQRHADARDCRGRTLYEDALDWFTDPDGSEPFSFVNVCEALGLDPEWIRSGLLRGRDAAAGRARPHRGRPDRTERRAA